MSAKRRAGTVSRDDALDRFVAVLVEKGFDKGRQSMKDDAVKAVLASAPPAWRHAEPTDAERERTAQREIDARAIEAIPVRKEGAP